MKIALFGNERNAACGMVRPLLVSTCDQYGMDFEEFSTDKDSKVFEKYAVSGIPVMIVFDDSDNELGRFMGLQTSTSIVNYLRKFGAI
jgi:thioredoxin-like negative regulator of GroEL